MDSFLHINNKNMLRSVRVFAVIILMYMVSGCSNINSTLAIAEYSSVEEKYLNLPINISLDLDNWPDQELTRWQYKDRIFLQNTFINAVIDEKAFVGISTVMGKYPHTVSIKYRSKALGNLGYAFGKAMVSALTLSLVPLNETVQHDVFFDVYLGSTLLKSYKYTDIRETTYRLAYEQQQDTRLTASNFVKHFLIDLKKDRLIPFVQKQNKPI